jgi:hypothetical protein
MKKFKDIAGKRYGSYLVIERVKKEGDKNTYFRCRCDCGEEKLICSQHLRYGKAKQCRACFENKHNLLGKHFGKLTVLQDGGLNNHKHPKKQWLCKCDCGNEIMVTTHHLIDGYSKSCGCTIKYKNRSQAAFNSLFSSYRASANARNLEFNLTRTEFKKLTKQVCYYCGEEPNQQFKRGTSIYIYNGIDQQDNSKGYIKHNVVSCCKKCNIAKHKQTEYDFLSWISKVYNKSCK